MQLPTLTPEDQLVLRYIDAFLNLPNSPLTKRIHELDPSARLQILPMQALHQPYLRIQLTSALVS